MLAKYMKYVTANWYILIGAGNKQKENNYGQQK